MTSYEEAMLLGYTKHFLFEVNVSSAGIEKSALLTWLIRYLPLTSIFLHTLAKNTENKVFVDSLDAPTLIAAVSVSNAGGDQVVLDCFCFCDARDSPAPVGSLVATLQLVANDHQCRKIKCAGWDSTLFEEFCLAIQKLDTMKWVINYTNKCVLYYLPRDPRLLSNSVTHADTSVRAVIQEVGPVSTSAAGGVTGTISKILFPSLPQTFKFKELKKEDA